jgi:murein L,D-transpeptidase YcbB/YkuD
MISFGRVLILGLLLIWPCSGPAFQVAAAEPAAADLEVRETLRQLLSAAKPARPIVRRGEVLNATPLLQRFYERRDFQPGWSRDGWPTSQVGYLVAVLGNAESEGLRPADYHLAGIKLLREQLARKQGAGQSISREELIDLDLLLSDAFLLYGSHLLNGRIDFAAVEEYWPSDQHGLDLAAILEETLAVGEVVPNLESLRPRHENYRKTLQALAAMRDLEKRGGWPLVADGPALQIGMRHVRVRNLRQRLMISGDYVDQELTGEDLFDEQLSAALQRFQNRHGLKSDGILGHETLIALNVPVADRIRQMELNLERWRWLSQDLGQRYILVNIADSSLQVMENSQPVLEMRVVVGKPQRSTPVFSDQVEYLVLNPYWYLPETIIIEDMVPKILENPDYLTKEKIKVFPLGNNTRELDPTTIDWKVINKKNLPYKMRQESGPFNVLGRVKIMFPNRFSIYLHDTPGQDLFQKSARYFSSGCIRLEKPIELAAYLLKDNPLWNREKIMDVINSGRQQVVVLQEQIPVHILYWTAWSDENGIMHFRNDIYGRDKLLAAALDGVAPEPGKKLPKTYAASVHMDEV